MNDATQTTFPGPTTSFHGLGLPEEALPVGYGALIDAYRINVPLPRVLTAISSHHRSYTEGRWRVLTPRYRPDATLADHLLFAVRHEGIDLAVLKRLFLACGPNPIEALVRNAPTGTHSRRVWFLYEWLTGEVLNLPDAKRGAYVKVLDEKKQLAATGHISKRHRLRNNLPGVPQFCPLAFLTEKTEALLCEDLAGRAREAIAAIPNDVLARAAAFLLLKDSKSSFDIEGEGASHNRIQRWGSAIAQAGQHPLDLAELLRLQEVVIEDNRFVTLGLRQEGVFVGEHDRRTGDPLPDHISARADDLPGLMSGLISFANEADRALDPIFVAALIAFGFVYIHPFEDGNGRVHRYLIHHVLAEREFAPHGLVFPVSAVILERIDAYRTVLEDYSARLLPHVDWTPTPSGNVEVTGDTADFYRYFDATPHVEFLLDCVKQTIEVELPQEARFLVAYDAFRKDIEAIVDMPERTLNLLFRFLSQNDGKLSKRARTKEFRSLTDEEVTAIEDAYAATDAFQLHSSL